MISATISRTPPQTYSRLFRPWDGRTNQDNTVTSTSSTSTKKIPSQMNVFLDIDNSQISENLSKSPRISVISEHELQKPIIDKIVSNNIVPSDDIQHCDKIIDSMMYHPSAVANSHGIPMDASSFYSTYPEFMMQTVGGPYVGNMDPFAISAMEQEYARVLAEEAQAKILSSRKQRPKKFKCPHCDVAFSNNGQLKGHIRIHTGKWFFYFYSFLQIIVFKFYYI